MSIHFNDGQQYDDWVSVYAGQPSEDSYHTALKSDSSDPEDLGENKAQSRDRKHQDFEQRWPKDYINPENLKDRQMVPGVYGKKGWTENIDREHHVPLVASAIMGEDGKMSGMAIDHRVQVPPEYMPHLALHEASELPHMQNLIDGGMSAKDAYHEAHDKIATPIETASVRAEAARNGQDPDQYHEQYKQFFRDAASIAKEPSDRERHPDAHTTRFALDEHELGHPIKPLQIDVLGAGTGIHSGPGATRMQREVEGKSSEFDKSMKDFHQAVGDTGIKLKYPANENIQGEMTRKSMENLKKLYEKLKEPEGDLAAMEKMMVKDPERYKYWKAYFQQKGGDDWDNWQRMENISRKLGGPPNPTTKKEPKFKTIEGGKE